MDHAKVLVRTVARAFYDTEHVVLVDALVHHQALTAVDCSIVLGDTGKNTKVIQKFLGKLKEGGLVSVHTRSEVRVGAQKPTQREWYYIDYRRAIDATKYRIHAVDERIKANTKPTQEKKDYVCPQCHAQFTAIEVMDNIDLSTGRFLCRRCNHALNDRYEEQEAETNDNVPAKFNKQFKALLDILQLIDQSEIPAVTGDEAINNHVDVARDEKINPTQQYVLAETPKSRPQGVKGMATGPEKIAIAITTTDETTAAEQAAAAERRAKIAAQNAVPEWHMRSTVTGEMTELGSKREAALRDSEVGTPLHKGGDDGEDKKGKQDPGLEAYFAALQEEQERERVKREQEEEDEYDDEDDEDEFEDVPVVATPQDDGTPAAKRIKVENGDTSAVPTPVPAPIAESTPAVDGGEESDEDEFEDAL